MNAFLNYCIEANLGLIFFFSIYWLALRNENQFAFKRIFLIGGVFSSLLFPFFTVGVALPFIPTLSQSATATWLSEIVVYANGNPQAKNIGPLTYWGWLLPIYLCIAFLLLVQFVFRIGALGKLFIQSPRYTWKKYTIAESDKVKGIFSFFNFIFLSPNQKLSDSEREEILRHEEVHIQRLHSIDIIIIQLLGIIFWFNPIIRNYKKSLVQIHEFEADARSVEGHNVDQYCHLLAKVALQSNGYVLANHFTNSFTLKRINMMKTIRMKIKNWKVLAVALTLPLFFFAVACQDQIEEIQEVGKNTSMALEIPKEVQDELNRMKIEAPDSEFIVVELNENGKQSLEKLKESNNTINDISKISVIRPTDDEISFAIIVKGRNTDRLSEITKSTDQVFTIVDEPASPTTSMTEFYGEIAKNLNYPDQARKLGVEGRVFIEFIVNEDGTLSGFKSLKGIGAGCDNEAIRVLKMSKPWNPGKQKGHVVKQRLVLPITFSLG